MTDAERLEFIKKKINYLVLKTARKHGKNQFLEDFIWLIEMAEKKIKRKKEKPQ